jgi:hypothetical protein
MFTSEGKPNTVKPIPEKPKLFSELSHTDIDIASRGIVHASKHSW